MTITTMQQPNERLHRLRRVRHWWGQPALVASLASIIVIGALVVVLLVFGGDSGEPAAPVPTPVDGDIPALESEQLVEALAVVGVFDAAGVNSYRGRMSWTAVGDCGARSCDRGKVEGEFIRNASRVQGYGGHEVIQVDSQAWHREYPGGDWMAGDAYGFGEPVPPLSFAWFSPATTSLKSLQALGAVNDYLLEVGNETVNGRSTVHYRVDKTGIELAAANAGHRIAITEGNLDVWIDDAGQFPVKWQLVVDGKGYFANCWGDCTLTYLNADIDQDGGRFEWSLELYDFGADITIEPPG